MKQLKFTLAIALFSSGIFHTLYAQSDHKINLVTSAVPFLRISPDARAGGMGEVGIATSPDASSAYWNLAKTSFNTSPAGVSFTYTPWLKRLGLSDVYLATATGYKILDERQAVAATFKYFSLGNIQVINGNGQDLGSTSPHEFSVDAGYTRKLSEKAALGVAFRYINSSLVKGDPTGIGTNYKAGSSFAADISYFYDGQAANGQGWNFGATLTNLGTKIGYTMDDNQKEYIPANLGIGAAYTMAFGTDSRISLGLELNKLLVPTPPAAEQQGNPPTEQQLAEYRNKGIVSSWFGSFSDAPGGAAEELREVQIGVGAEYWYMEQFALRTGYFHEDAAKGGRKYLTFGVGLKYQSIGFNFAYLASTGRNINQNPLSNTIRFGIQLDFKNLVPASKK